jgi:hypothetical protein
LLVWSAIVKILENKQQIILFDEFLGDLFRKQNEDEGFMKMMREEDKLKKRK